VRGTLGPAELHIYPTALKVEAVLSEAAQRAGCLFDYRVVTFPELADMIFREAGHQEPLLPEPLARALVGSEVSRTLPRLGRFERASVGAGAAQGFLRVIREFEEAYLTPDDVEELRSRLDREEARRRLGMLNAVYRGYHESLTRLGWIDRHRRQWRAIAHLRECRRQGRRPRCLEGIRKVVFAELYDLSVTQFLLATTLISLVGDAELVTHSEAVDVDEMAFCQRTWNRFVEDSTIADLVLPEFVPRPQRRGNLGVLLDGLFRPASGAPVRRDGSVELMVAQSRYYECEEVGRRVRRLLEAGATPDRIAVLARGLGVYGDLLEDVFRRYRIPVYFRKGRPLASIGVTKHLVNLLRCVAEGFSRERLASVLGSPYFGLGIESAAALLAQAGYLDQRRTPIGELRRAMQLKLARTAGPRPLGDPWPDRAVLSEVWEKLGPIESWIERASKLDGKRSLAEHASALLELLGETGVGVAQPHTPVDLARRDAVAWERCLEMLRGMERAGAGLVPDPAEFVSFLGLLLDALGPEQLEEPASSAGGVSVLTVEDARGLEFDFVFLLGLDDGTFPSATGDDPLLPDRIRVEMNREAAQLLRGKLQGEAGGVPLGVVFRTSSEERKRDPFLFFLAVSMARQKLILSYPVLDEKGNPTVRSPFLDEVAALVEIETPEVSARVVGEVVPKLEDCFEVAEVANRLALEGLCEGPSEAVALLEEKIGEARVSRIRRRAAIERNRAAYFRGRGTARRTEIGPESWPYLGKVAAAAGELAPRIAATRWDTAAVDDLGACRFKFFAAHVLRIGVKEEGEAWLALRRQGELVHVLLREIFERYPGLPEDWPALRSSIVEHIATARQRFLERVWAPERAFWELAWESVEEAILELLAAEFTESRSLGHSQRQRLLEWPCALVIEDHRRLPAEQRLTLALSGRIDRVDLLSDPQTGGLRLVRVVDYKLSRGIGYQSRLDPAKAMGTTSFQVPIYLMALLERPGGLDGVRPETCVEACYYCLRAERKIVKREIDRAILALDPETRAVRGEPVSIASKITELFARARAGSFEVDPVECDDFCPYRPLCRYRPSSPDAVVERP